MVRAGTDLSVIADMVSERDAMALLDSIFESLVDSKLPFSCTHGNHDNSRYISHEAEITREQQLAPT